MCLPQKSQVKLQHCLLRVTRRSRRALFKGGGAAEECSVCGLFTGHVSLQHGKEGMVVTALRGNTRRKVHSSGGQDGDVSLIDFL